MGLNLNKMILGGRLTADPELQTTGSGLSVTHFTVAVDRKVARDAERKTDFFECTAWRERAEFITRFFRKGSSICLIGSMQSRSYEKDGQTRRVWELQVDEAYFADSKSDKAGGGEAQPTYIPDAYKVTAEAAPKFEDIGPDEELPF